MIIYEGISPSGEKITGKFAGSKQELLEYLKSEKIILVSIKEYNPEKKKGKLSVEKIYSTIEQLYYLLSAGLKIDKAVYTIIKNLNDKSLIEFWEDILKMLKEGKQFSVALKEVSMHKNINIPDFYINILSVGETIGDIKASLKTMMEDVIFKQNLKKEIKSSLSYPVFLIIMSIITVFTVAVFILPKFAQIFSQDEISRLPVISKFVINFGLYIKENLSFIVFAIIAFILIGIYSFRLKKTKQFIMDLLYKTPYLSHILIKLELSNIFSSLSTMLKGGIHINRAVKLTKTVTNHPNLKNVLEEIQNELKKGRKISQVLNKYPFIPYDAVALISVGEESAKLEDILEKLSEKYITEFKDSISKLLGLLEPVVIVFVGFFIGFIVIAILLAVLSISDVF